MDNRNGNINKAQLLSCLKQVRDQLHDQAPLIHCITHPIVVNDCANAVLALGGRPIMAEHPAEVADISASAAALTVSLGNITDARAESMLLAGKAIKRMKDAENAKRASVIDLVGITCSPFRMELAKRFIKECKPAVIKGNGSDIWCLTLTYDLTILCCRITKSKGRFLGNFCVMLCLVLMP